MKSNVMLKIEGRQWNDSEEPQSIRLMTEGQFFRREDAWYVVYDESSATGMEGTVTTMCVADDGSVNLSREGSHEMNLYFLSGRRHITRMETPYGDLDVEVYTSLVKSDLNKKGGFIQLGYTIDLNKRERLNTRLNVEIKLIN